MNETDAKYIYQIESSIHFDTLIDVIREELNLKAGKISYFSLDIDDWFEEILPINELKDKALEIFFSQDNISLIFPNVEVNLGEDRIELLSENKLILKGIDVDNIINNFVEDKPEIKLNLDKFKLEEIVW